LRGGCETDPRPSGPRLRVSDSGRQALARDCLERVAARSSNPADGGGLGGAGVGGGFARVGRGGLRGFAGRWVRLAVLRAVWFRRFACCGGVARLRRARWALCGLGVLRAWVAWLAFGEHAGRCVVWACCVLRGWGCSRRMRLA
jgi:hypothetical protein